jgi:hypothetical protein
MVSSADPLWKLNNANAYLVTNIAPLSGIRMVIPPARWIQRTNYPKPAGAAWKVQVHHHVQCSELSRWPRPAHGKFCRRQQC